MGFTPDFGYFQVVPTRVWFLCSLAVLFLLTGCGSQTGPSPAQAASPAPAPTVSVAQAQVRNLTREVLLTAEFIPFQEVDVMAKVSGYVREIGVDVGDHVRPGQRLAILEVPEMRDDLVRSEATIAEAEAEVVAYRDEVRRSDSAHQLAHLSYQRLAGVVKERPGLVAQQEIDDSQTRDQVAESQLAAATSRLNAAQRKVSVTRADLARVKTMLAYTEVTAPFAGIITKRYANTGSMIQAGTASQTQAMPLVRLSQSELLRLILPVPESIVPLVRLGQTITVRVPTLNRTFPGRVARFSGKVQSATRTMETEIDVPNPGFTLVAGMYAEANFPTDTRTGALSVPITAVDLKPGSDTEGSVMVVSPDGVLETRNVTLGLETADFFEVRSGLQDGTNVVTGNRANLRVGQHVSPKLAQ